jgi:hypothetical protein
MSAEPRQDDVPRDAAAPSDPASVHEVMSGDRLALSVEEAGALLGISRDWLTTWLRAVTSRRCGWGGGSSSLAVRWRRHWPGWSGQRSMTVRVVRLVVAVESREAWRWLAVVLDRRVRGRR